MPIPAPFPTYTKTWHNEPYAALDPRRVELSAKGRTVIITGAGTGIGAATAKAFAEAGAAKIVLVARRHHTLEEVKSTIEDKFSRTTVTVYSADVTNLSELKKTASEVNGWDVLVLNAAYLPQPGVVLEADVEDWTQAYQVNVIGVVLCLQAFIPFRNEKAKVIGVSSAIAALPPESITRMTGYTASKLAMTKVLEIFAAEMPDVYVTNFHPGVVVEGSEIGQKAKMSHLPRDDVNLPARFTLWLASDDALFLRGKFTYCNWDVEELKSKTIEVTSTQVLTTGVLGSPWLGPQAP